MRSLGVDGHWVSLEVDSKHSWWNQWLLTTTLNFQIQDSMSLHILYAGDQHQGRALTFNPACDDMFWPLFLFFSCDDYNQNNFGCNSNHIFLKGSTIERQWNYF